MTRFHQVVEQVEAGRGVHLVGITKRQTDAVVTLFNFNKENVICFDAGEVINLSDFKIIPELARLPYESCWIEFTHRGEIGGCLAHESGGVVVCQFWAKLNEYGWCYGFTWTFEPRTPHETICFTEIIAREHLKDEEIKQIHKDKNFTASIVLKFLSALNCTNVKRREHKAPEKLQKAREKRGKKPLFSYYTLELDLPKSRTFGVDLGGTHASPRVHLRRGHPRQYEPGKWCWVQAHAVGNKALGMIHKDYAANYPDPALL